MIAAEFRDRRRRGLSRGCAGAIVLVALASAGCGSSTSSPSTVRVAVPSLYATGELPLASGTSAVDARWQVECATLPPATAPCPTTGSNAAAVVASSAAPSDWARPGGTRTANWIGLTPSGSIPGTSAVPGSYQYTFRTTVDLTGFDPATVTLTADWSGDNVLVGWRVNDTAWRDGTTEDTPWRGMKSLVVPAATAQFTAGANTLEIRVVGDGQTDGLVVANLAGTGARK